MKYADQYIFVVVMLLPLVIGLMTIVLLETRGMLSGWESIVTRSSLL